MVIGVPLSDRSHGRSLRRSRGLLRRGRGARDRLGQQLLRTRCSGRRAHEPALEPVCSATPRTASSATRGTDPSGQQRRPQHRRHLRGQYRGLVNYYLLAGDVWRLNRVRCATHLPASNRRTHRQETADRHFRWHPPETAPQRGPHRPSTTPGHHPPHRAHPTAPGRTM